MTQNDVRAEGRLKTLSPMAAGPWTIIILVALTPRAPYNSSSGTVPLWHSLSLPIFEKCS